MTCALAIDQVAQGVAGYTISRLLPTHPGRLPVSQWWSLHGVWRSLQWSGSRAVLKCRDGFTDHETPELLEELVREAREYGAQMPGSYAGMWWSAKERPALPRMRHLHRRYGLIQISGAWQEAFMHGPLLGRWIHYDIVSAYLWAISLGLPDPKTFRWVHPDYHAGGRNVVYLASFPARIGAPYPYNRGGDLLATEEEMGEYRADPTEVYGGISWQGSDTSYDTSRIISSIRRYSVWKQIARGWWGYLASRTGVVRHFPDGRRIQMVAPFAQNPVWAHIILSRVRRRLWDVVKAYPGDVARVYVDSVIIRDRVKLSVGNDVGQWKIKEMLDRPDIRSAVEVRK